MLWFAKMDWSEPFPGFTAREVFDFDSALSEIENLNITSFIFPGERLMLHRFSDASLLAYGAVIYIQSILV